MKRVALVLAIPLILPGCTSPPSAPEHLGGKLTVLPVNNRSGDDLVVSGEGVLDRYLFRTPSTGLADILEAEAGFQLREKGFEVPLPLATARSLKGRVPRSPQEAAELAAQAGLGSPCLYLEIRRWEPEGRAHVNSVLVDVVFVLLDPANRTELWRSQRRGPIPTPGQFLVGSAYVAAARKVIAEVLTPVLPEVVP